MQITQKQLPLAKFLWSIIVQHNETNQCRNFQNDLSTDVGVTAPETVLKKFFLQMYNFEILILQNHLRSFNENKHIGSLVYCGRNDLCDF